MSTIICTRCGASVETEVQSGQDFSTFVCGACSEKANIPAYEAELAELQANPDKTESEARRVEFLEAKLSALV